MFASQLRGYGAWHLLLMKKFSQKDLQKLYKPASSSFGEENGQVTIIGGSKLFHGAPIFPLIVASRIVDMVFFATPEKSVGRIAEQIKSKLMSFIWVPWEEVEEYVEKSDAVLIGPGFLRYRSEKVNVKDRFVECDEECRNTMEITKRFLTKFPNKKWVIDAGSLQTMDPEWIPENAILTPNKHEYLNLFAELPPEEAAKKYKCIIVVKGPTTFVYSPDDGIEVNGGNPGLTKGGTGDTQAGLTVALLAKNDPLLAAAGASYLLKKAADELHGEVGTGFNADDLVNKIPPTFFRLTK